MNLRAKREYRSTVLPDGMTEVSSDGRTVWVNREGCLARFCPISREYVAVSAEDSATGLAYEERTKRHPSAGPSMVDWGVFVATVHNRWGIGISVDHTPLYIMSDRKPK